jgi:hypothetical protein
LQGKGRKIRSKPRPDLIRNPGLPFRYSVANDTVYPSTRRIISQAHAINRAAIQKCVSGCTAHDGFAIGVMDQSSTYSIRLFR